jgi:hypothetical protein
MTKEIYEFRDARQVEILARCCRQWERLDKVDEQAAKLAEIVLKVNPDAF